MKKILGLILLVVSLHGFSQNPTNYQYRTVRERLLAMMTDSTFHPPRYNGIPSGRRVGSSTHDGMVAIDTLNHGFFLFGDSVWRKVGTEGIKCGLTCSSCGLVTWTGTGLNFNVTAADYNLNSAAYHFSGDSITLDAAHATLDRFDAIVLTSSGLSKVTGTAAADPQLPQFDPCASVLLTYIFVQATTTTPTQISDQLIYDEDAETWTHTTSGTISANFQSNVTAFHGDTSLRIASWSNNANIIFTAPGSLVTSNYSTFSFWIRLTAIMVNTQNISVQFFNGTAAISNQVVCQFTKGNISTFQSVTINMPQFTFTQSTFTAIRLIFSGSQTNVTYIDWIRLQAGVTQPQPPTATSSVNIYNSNGILTGNRTLTGRNNTYNLSLDSLDYFRAGRDGAARLYFNSTTTSNYSPDNNTLINISNGLIQLSTSSASNYLWQRADSSIFHKRASYEYNIHGTFNDYSLVDKSYVDSVAGGSGTNIYNSNGTLTGTRTLSLNTLTLNIQQSSILRTSFAPSGFTAYYDNGTRIGSLSIDPGNGIMSSSATDELGLASYVQTIDSLILRSVHAGFGRESRIIVKDSAIRFRSTMGNYYFNDIPAGAGTKSVRVDPSTGKITYADTTSGGGDGGIHSVNAGVGLIKVNDSTLRADTAIANANSISSNARLQKLIDSLASTVVTVSEQYQYWFDISGSTNANMYGPIPVGTGAATTRLSTAFASWMGGLEMTTGTTTTGMNYMHFGNSGVISPIAISTSNRYNYGVKLRLEDLSDGTDTYHIMSGYSDHNNDFASAVDAICFTYTDATSSGQWVCHTRSNSTTTSTASGVTVAADTDYELTITVFNTEVKFYINGSLVATHTTNIPSGTARETSIANTIRKSAGTTSRKMYLEWLAYGKFNF